MPGYPINTGTIEPSITSINGEKVILRYRGYPIADLCKKPGFLAV